MLQYNQFKKNILKGIEEQMESTKLTIVKLFKRPIDKKQLVFKKLIFEMKFRVLLIIQGENFSYLKSTQQPDRD